MRPIVANAEKTYVDPSALRRLYVHDAQSRAFCAWRARISGALSITLHGRAELVNSIALAVFRHDIPKNAADAALVDVSADMEQGRLVIADLPWRQAYEQATELSRVHTPVLGTRTLDVLHVASARVMGMRSFVTYDERQSALAKAVGLRVVCP